MAVVLAIVVFVGSLTIGGRESAADQVRGSSGVGEFVNYGKTAPAPCRKALLPGAVNTCPFSNLSLVAIPTIKPDHAVPAMLTFAHWGLRNTTLPAQCSGFSPYRPPCLFI